MAIRICTDLAPVTAGNVIGTEQVRAAGFTAGTETIHHRLTYDVLLDPYRRAPGLSLDKLKGVLTRKLDADFFAGRWARATDRQRALLSVISRLENCDDEFTVQEVVEKSRRTLDKPFSSSHTNQMLAALAAQGLVFENRHGRYSFAVPLLGRFIRRQSTAQDSAP